MKFSKAKLIFVEYIIGRQKIEQSSVGLYYLFEQFIGKFIKVGVVNAAVGTVDRLHLNYKI